MSFPSNLFAVCDYELRDSILLVDTDDTRRECARCGFTNSDTGRRNLIWDEDERKW